LTKTTVFDSFLFNQRFTEFISCRGHKEGLTMMSSDQSPTQVMGQYSEQSTLRIGEPSAQKPSSSHRAAAAAAAGGQRRRHHSGSAPGQARTRIALNAGTLARPLPLFEPAHLHHLL